TAPGQVHVVASVQAAMPAAAIEQAAEVAAEANAAEVMQRLRGSPAGRWYLELFDRHRDELLRLIRQNRRIATAWQRTGISELADGLRCAVLDREARVPATVAGRSALQSIEEFARVLERYASAALVGDVERVRRTLPSIGDLTIAEICDRLAALPAAREPQ